MPEHPGPRPAPDSVAASARRKVAWRILPLLLAMYVVAYLDRANVGFAKDRMQAELEFSDTAFGIGVGLFFVGYLVLEIPGALFVERWSARKWFARILVSWGICSMAMALVRTPEQFYLVRFLLGLAEAGFFPGVIVYFTHWFRREDRARAMGAMLFAVPVSLAAGARVSAVLLEQNWLGLAGWQWVFLVEGAPAVALGVLIPFILPDWPRDARWLTPAEREWLEATLEAERQETLRRAGNVTLRQTLGQRTVWLLAFGIFATNMGGYVFVFWLPTIVKGLLQMNGLGSDQTTVLNWTGLVFLCGVAGVWISGWSSDRTGDRKWHCVAGQFGTGVFLTLAAVPGLPWAAVFSCLCVAGFFANFWYSPFWVLPTQALTASAAAVSIGFINMWANSAGAIGSPVVGVIKDAGGGDRAAMLFVAATFATGGVIVGLMRVRRPGRAEMEGEHGQTRRES